MPLDPGRLTVTIRVEAVRFTCPSGHEWVWGRAEIHASPDTVETCPGCGETAVDAAIEAQSRSLEQRGVVLSFPRSTPADPSPHDG